MRNFALVLAAVAFASMAPQPSSAAAVSASIASKPATSLVGGVTFYRRHYDYYPRYRYSEYRYYPRHRYYYDDDVYYPRLLYFPYESYYRPYRNYYYRRDRY
jgi:hypothetical protein